MTEPETVDLFGVEVFRAGTWNGAAFDQGFVEALARNYSTTTLIAPVTLDHRADGPAYGFISRLVRDGARLVADLTKVPASLAAEIKAGRWPNRSAEIVPDLDGRGPYMTAITLLGAKMPAVRGMAPVTLSTKHPGAWALAFAVHEGKQIMPDHETTPKPEAASKQQQPKGEEAPNPPAKFEDAEARAENARLKAELEAAKAREIEADKRIASIEAERFAERTTLDFNEVWQEALDDNRVAPAAEAEARAIYGVIAAGKTLKFADSEMTAKQAFAAFLSKLQPLVPTGTQASFKPKTGGDDDIQHFGEARLVGARRVEAARKYAQEHKTSFEDALVAIDSKNGGAR